MKEGGKWEDEDKSLKEGDGPYHLWLMAGSTICKGNPVTQSTLFFSTWYPFKT